MPIRGEGYVHLGFKKLNEKDLKKILLKCDAPRRERRPRKCRRLDSEIDGIISNLPNTVKDINLVGNKTLGDAGTKHLHLLPSTLQYLDLSDCGITLEGLKNICQFMKTNTSITRLIMWGNSVGDEGAAYVADMLSQNKTLRNLCIMGCNIGVEGFSHISRGLAHNDTLHIINLGNFEHVFGDEHMRRLCPGLAVNRGLQALLLRGVSGLTNQGLEPVEVALRENYHLKSIELSHHYFNHEPRPTWQRIEFWMALNKLDRQIMLRDENVALSKWHEILMNSHEAGNISAIYYFLRHKPELCRTFQANTNDA